MADFPLDELLKLVGDDSKMAQKDLEPLRELAFRQLSQDFPSFYQLLWHIETVGKGYALPEMRPYQVSEAKLLSEAMNRKKVREVRLKARQIGFTTISAAAAFWSAYFHPYHSWLISSRTEDDAKDTLLEKVRVPYSYLPEWIKDRGPQVEVETSQEFSFDNGSKIRSIPASAGAGRSKAVFGVLVDEFAFVEDGSSVLSALLPLCYGPMLVFSTANGIGNPYHTTWIDGTRNDSEWNALSRELRPKEKWNGTFQPWSSVPGRDQTWYEREMRANRGQMNLFYQENPSTPAEAFAKSGRVVIDPDVIAETVNPPSWRVDLQLLDLTNDIEINYDALIPEGEERDDELWIWAMPEEHRSESGLLLWKPNYVMGVDVSEGLAHGDRTSIVVGDANTHEVVATYNGYWAVEDLGVVLNWLGKFYKTALIGPERNNHGMVPIVKLQELRYPRKYRMDSPGQVRRHVRNPRYGWYTSRATKPKMVRDGVEQIKSGAWLLNDTRFVAEAGSFIADGKGGYGAAPPNHDDHIMALFIMFQMYLDVGSYPIVWSDPVEKALTMGEVMKIGLNDEAQELSPLTVGLRRVSATPVRTNSF